MRSMETTTLALAVASHNIANEKTPGYTKQRLVVQPSLGACRELAPSKQESTTYEPSLVCKLLILSCRLLIPDRLLEPGDWMERFLIGSGVETIGVEAVRDRLLEGRLRQEVSSNSGDDLLHGKLRDIEVLFNDAADTGMLPAITKFFNSFHSLALDPSSINLREQVRIAADDLTRSFRTRGEELLRIQTVADENLQNHIDKVRSLAGRIADVTVDIEKQESGGQTANALRDQRNVHIQELSEYISVTELNSGDYFQLLVGGALLVFDGRTAPVVADTSGPSGFAAVKIGPTDVSSTLISGRIYAEQQIRDKYVPDYLNKLDQLAFEITQQVNAIHSVSYDVSGNTGVDFFDPLGVASDAARQIKLSAAIQGDLNQIAAAARRGVRTMKRPPR